MRNYLSTTPWRRMGERRCSSSILDLGSSWRWALSAHTGCFTPGERDPGTQGIGGWVSPGARLGLVEKVKLSCPFRESNPGRLARRYADWAIPAHFFYFNIFKFFTSMSI
jgi:hypothetical protein